MKKDEKEDIPESGAPEPAAPAGEPSIEGLKQEDIALEERLSEAEQKAEANWDLYLRSVADLENYKKRIAREREQAARYGHEPLLRELLPVLDNLERAIEACQKADESQNETVQGYLEGLELVRKQLLDVLNRFGVVPVEALGEAFNPALHEGLAQAETTEREPNTVVDEHLKGYLLHDRLLRPARVTVAVAPSASEASNGSETKDEPPLEATKTPEENED